MYITNSIGASVFCLWNLLHLECSHCSSRVVLYHNLRYKNECINWYHDHWSSSQGWTFEDLWGEDCFNSLLQFINLIVCLQNFLTLLYIFAYAFDSINLSAFKVPKARLYLCLRTYGPNPCLWHITHAKLSVGCLNINNCQLDNLNKYTVLLCCEK